MARLRPFKGLRYTLPAGELGLLLAPPSASMTPAEREGYAARSPHNAVALAFPEGHGDDRSKFVRYARSAARLADWRREGFLAAAQRPAFYRLTQRYGKEPSIRTTLIAVADPTTGVEAGQAAEARVREDRLRLMEATRAVFEPSLAFYHDAEGAKREAVRNAPASSEGGGSLGQTGANLETIDDPDAVEEIVRVFADTPLLVSDGVEGLEAAREFGCGGFLVGLAAFEDPSFSRLAVHRVLRRLPGGKEAALVRLAERLDIEPHHNRNLIRHVDEATGENRAAFGLATEGGLGYLLTPREAIVGPAAVWLHREILAPILGVGEADPTLSFTDPVQAIRAADEGAAGAFILPHPPRSDLLEARRLGHTIPAGAARTYPAIPTGLVFWSMGDDA